ncbi:hypothetical protein PBRA_009553 [Plasmodiophora brassicae]|uniref:USP domain-containing protein n=1 Tax=Plasmodiophora brassicae TaxID=37360 RepID=A0A0G4J8L3_PLABS|nr:hypothetical protein PBRA_009553 [Plasmodiophora brassicae]
MSSSESDSDESSRDTSDLCQFDIARERGYLLRALLADTYPSDWCVTQSKRNGAAGRRPNRSRTKARPMKPSTAAPMTLSKGPANKRSRPRAPVGVPSASLTVRPGKRARRPVPHVDREPIENTRRAAQEQRDARSLLPAGISNNDEAGVCRSICYAIAPMQILRALPGWERVSGHAPWVDLNNQVMNRHEDPQVASATLVDLIKVISNADRATRSFDAGQQHDADDFALELLHQMSSYSVTGSNGQPIERAIVGFVEHVVDTCTTCGHATRRPPCELPVVMLGGSRGRTTLAEALVSEHTTTLTRRCSSERPCNSGRDVEHRCTTLRQMKGQVVHGQAMIVRQDPIRIVRERGPDGQLVTMARRKTTVDVVPEAVVQVSDAYFELVGLVDHQGDAHVAGHDEGHYVSWVKQARGGWAFCDTSRVQLYPDVAVACLLRQRVFRLLFYTVMAVRTQ